MPAMTSVNPFVFTRPITDPPDFFNCEREKDLLKLYLEKGLSCQVVAPAGYGKTSLLQCLDAFAKEWNPVFLAAYVDLENPECRTVKGFIEAAEQGWGDLETAPARENQTETLPSLSRLADRVEHLRHQGRRPILCLDNFDTAVSPKEIFPSGFFTDLRYIVQRSLPTVTASERPLGEIMSPYNLTSPFFNVFGLIHLGLFSEDDAHDFVTLKRPDVPKFTKEEKQAILEFAKGHPMKLQIACHFVLEAKHNSESLTTAILKAMNTVESRHAA